MITLEALLAGLEPLAKSKKPPATLWNGGTRVRVIKNAPELNTNPGAAPGSINFHRALLWNLHGEIWLEEQHWITRPATIETSFHKAGNADETRALACPKTLHDNMSIASGRAASLVTEEKAGRILKLIRQAIDRTGEPDARPPLLEKTVQPEGDPTVVYQPGPLLECFREYAENPVMEQGRFLAFTEKQEGCRAGIQWWIQPDKLSITREIHDSRGVVRETRQVRNNPIAFHHLPSATAEQLVEEQFLWSDWHTRALHTKIEFESIESLLHRFKNLESIRKAFFRKQPPTWQRKIAASAGHSLPALVIACMANPSILSRMTRKLMRSSKPHPICNASHNAGISNHILLKYHWQFHCKPGPGKNAAKPSTLSWF